MRRLLGLAFLLVVAVAPPAAAVEACTGFGPVRSVGTVADGELTEISGVVASRTHPGAWWVHEDSGAEAAIALVGEKGDALGTYRLEGAEAFDWEDIAAAKGQLYLADIGDNGRQRKDPRVFRVTELSGDGGTLTGVEVIHLAYPDGPVDAEALLVDPTSGDLLVLTKELGLTRAFRAPAASLVDGAHVALEEVADFPLSLVTGADVSSDGTSVVVRTYGSVVVFRRPAGKDLAAAFDAPSCEAPSPDEPQGEAIAWSADGRSYVTISEGVHPALHRVEVRAAATTTTAAPEGAAGSSSMWPLAALVGGLAVLAVVVLSRSRAGRPRTPASRRP